MAEHAEVGENGGTYDASYLEWKHWAGEDFGTLKRSTAIYYAAEMKRAGLSGKTGLKVLEIGFGNGAFLTFCRQKGWAVVGTEINPELVAVATEAGFDARSVSQFHEIQPASFDAVVAIDVLEHIPPEATLSFMSGLMRVLKPGGVFVAHFPNGDSPFGLYSQNGDATHVNAIGTDKARYYARSVGADIVLLRGEARPIPAGSLPHSLHRVLALPFRLLANCLVNIVFLPGAKIDFCAPNLTMILRKKDAHITS